MKTFKYIYLFITSLLLLSTGCSKVLDEDVYSQLSPETVFSSQKGIESLLFNAYFNSQILGNRGNNTAFFEEFMTDIGWETGGSANKNFVLMQNYTFDATSPVQFATEWTNRYKSIRNCNLILERIDNVSMDEEVKNRMKAEARFIRASDYFTLYTFYGTVPLRISSDQALELKRCSEEEIKTFIETEFQDIVEILPKKGEISSYQWGRATKGAALGYLTKFYLQTKQWEKCADAAQKVIDLHIYSLWPDYKTLFTVENELINNEYIYVWVADVRNGGNANEYMNGAFPIGFASTTENCAFKTTFTDNMKNWARQDRLYDSFYNSFTSEDKRKELILTEYINNSGQAISLLNQNNTRAFKFLPDPNAVANGHGNDMPVIRYADILLSKAEALNELNGPTQEVIDLINQVRDRAGVSLYSTSDFTKETFRNAILNERGWEFYTERKRRQDMIRFGKLISNAQERGIVNAKDYMTVFPIPQIEIDSNPLCKQNPGY